jgi:hypothetical protein
MLRPYRRKLSAPARSSRFSAQTTFRAMLLATTQPETPAAPSSRRQSALLAHIERALTLEELLDLAPHAVGEAELAWHRRLRDFPDSAPLIAQRLSASETVLSGRDPGLLQEHLIAALFGCGVLGAAHLLACLDRLGPYAQSQACVALGLLHHRSAADRIWQCYQTVASDPHCYLGPLWGLIDLPDPRATRALTMLMLQKRTFAELYGLLARWGGAACVIPLVDRLIRLPKARRQDVFLALAAIAQRIGPEALYAELARISFAPDPVVTMSLLTLPAQTISAHFAWYHPEIVEGLASPSITPDVRVTFTSHPVLGVVKE